MGQSIHVDGIIFPSNFQVYGRGSGPDCRRHVQQLNTMRGEIASLKEASVTDSFGYHGNPEEEVQVHDEGQAYCSSVSLQVSKFNSECISVFMCASVCMCLCRIQFFKIIFTQRDLTTLDQSGLPLFDL